MQNLSNGRTLERFKEQQNFYVWKAFTILWLWSDEMLGWALRGVAHIVWFSDKFAADRLNLHAFTPKNRNFKLVIIKSWLTKWFPSKFSACFHQFLLRNIFDHSAFIHQLLDDRITFWSEIPFLINDINYFPPSKKLCIFLAFQIPFHYYYLYYTPRSVEKRGCGKGKRSRASGWLEGARKNSSKIKFVYYNEASCNANIDLNPLKGSWWRLPSKFVTF